MPKILILTDWFLPGFKAGGPIQSLSNLVNALEHEVEFYVLTTHADHGETTGYEGIQTDKWLKAEQHWRCYCSPENTKAAVKSAVLDSQFDVIYLNSFFSSRFSIWPLWCCWRAQVLNKVILAPRGMLGAGALRIKSLKKRLFIRGFRLLGWHEAVRFHSTAQFETADIRLALGSQARIHTIANFPVMVNDAVVKARSHRPTRFVFASRISPKKGLLRTLEAVETISGQWQLDVYGEADDSEYFTRCQKAAGKHVVFHGAIGHGALMQSLAAADFFVLPTENENFGHAIIEALSNGTPVLISNQTPWNDIGEKGAGWVLPLTTQKWVAAMQEAVLMPDHRYAAMSAAALNYTREQFDTVGMKEQYLSLFGAKG